MRAGLDKLHGGSLSKLPQIPSAYGRQRFPGRASADATHSVAGRYGARVLAQSCKKSKQKKIVAKLEGSVALSRLIAHPSNDKLVTASLHALLNLSTEENNQAQIGKCVASRVVQMLPFTAVRPPH